MQATVSVQPSVWVVVTLLFGPDHAVKRSHASALTGSLTIPNPSAPGRTAKVQTGRIPPKTQRGPDRDFLQGRVGNHL